ncbi:MAG: FecR domain-containing protein [Acidimicrobiia bacterium]
MTRRRVAALVAAGTFTFVACSGGGDDDGPLAELRPEEQKVEVAAEEGSFREGENDQALAAGNTVRTNDTGRAQIDYSDGSLTRLDFDTIYTVVELSDDEGQRRVEGELGPGQSWNRVQELSESDSFQAESAGATAAVQGTAWTTLCKSDVRCLLTVVTGVVGVDPRRGDPIHLGPGDQVPVTDGKLGEVEQKSPDELFANPWIRYNLEKDAEQGKSGGDASGSTSRGGNPSADDLDIARVNGTWDVDLTAETVDGFVDLAPGTIRTRAYEVDARCAGGDCSLSLTRQTAAGPRTTPLQYDDGVYRATDPDFATQDCLLADGSVAVPNGNVGSATLEFEVTDAVVDGGAWTATEIAGTATETASPSAAGCLPGSATFTLSSERSA